MRTDYNNNKKTGGIYAAIIVCLAAVLVLTYFSAKSIFNKIPDDEWSKAASSEASDIQNDNTSSDTMLPTVKPESNIKSESSSKDTSSKNSSATNGTGATVKKKVNYNLPVNGNVVLAFSNVTPVFSKTMQDWRMHSGVDIAGNIGDSVKAAADGTVEDVYTDELKGVTVVIAHADNVKTLYCGLDKDVVVEKGAIVKEGDIIGKIGNTNELESLEASHLHFEMIKSGIYLDPVAMMK